MSLRLRRACLLLLTVFLLPFSGSAQGYSKGTQFWLTLLENIPVPFNNRSRIILAFSGEKNTTIRVKVPRTGFIETMTMEAGKPVRYYLPDVPFYLMGSDVTGNKGILVESDEPISVMAMHSRGYFSDATRVLPLQALGNDYIIITNKDDYEKDQNEFAIVSTSDNCQVEITPSVLTDGLRPPGLPYIITLNRGETHQVQALGDLTGTRVRSVNGEMIAVFAGAKMAGVKTPACRIPTANNHLYEQLPPVAAWGRFYVAMPFRGQGIAKVKVIRQHAGVPVLVDGHEVRDTGIVERYITRPALISSDSNICVLGLVVSLNCAAEKIGDPSMAIIPPANYLTFKETWYSLDTGVQAQFTFRQQEVYVITKTSGIGALRLNGQVPQAQFAPVAADPSWSTANLAVSNGFHTLSSDSGFVAVVYGLGDFDSYSYSLSGTPSLFTPHIVPVDTVIVPPPASDTALKDPGPAHGLPGIIVPPDTTSPFLPQRPDVIVYPNPTTGPLLKLLFPDADSTGFPVTFRLLDMLGKTVLEKTAYVQGPHHTEHLDVQGLRSAVYHLYITLPGISRSYKVFINKNGAYR